MLTIKQLAVELEASRPAGSDYKIVPNLSIDRNWSSIRIRTPFFYPSGERIYVYVEMYHKADRLLRMHDDEVTYDHLTYRDLGRELLRRKKEIGRDVLEGTGFKFVAARPEVSGITTPEELWEAVPRFAHTLNAVVLKVSEARIDGVTKPEPLINRIFEHLILGSKEMGIATA